jgi:hypothetical protein
MISFFDNVCTLESRVHVPPNASRIQEGLAGVKSTTSLKLCTVTCRECLAELLIDGTKSGPAVRTLSYKKRIARTSLFDNVCT